MGRVAAARNSNLKSFYKIAVISVAPISTRDGSPGTREYRHVCGKRKKERKKEEEEKKTDWK